jgi:hypothetical protein
MHHWFLLVIVLMVWDVIMLLFLDYVALLDIVITILLNTMENLSKEQILMLQSLQKPEPNKKSV